MDKKVILSPKADEEIAEAYFWYETREPGLGERFLSALEEAVSSITQSPGMYPLRFDAVRRITLKKFPFGVYYEHDERHIFVQAVFHEARNPSHLGRLKSP